MFCLSASTFVQSQLLGFILEILLFFFLRNKNAFVKWTKKSNDLCIIWLMVNIIHFISHVYNIFLFYCFAYKCTLMAFVFTYGTLNIHHWWMMNWIYIFFALVQQSVLFLQLFFSLYYINFSFYSYPTVYYFKINCMISIP